jgi:tryptophan halogenase
MRYVVVGGGTAGWLTALYINKHFPDDQVTVIASSEIGILGAGEGTTPPFIDFLKEVDISEKDLYDNCKATIKNGIKFTNWNGNNDEYFHNFTTGLNALHFDASLLAKYFQNLATSRGVELIDDEVVYMQCHPNEDIESFVLKSGNVEHADFVFDCSGFRRFIIGGFYKSNWTEYSMPCKRAIPFFLPNDGQNLPPYTESIAMKYGWIWKIPVQGRYGCGYVFDSSMTTDEDAKEEIRQYLGHDFVSPRTFNFSAGAYDKCWINNCMAVGLSAGFIEPLEATSIWVQIMALRIFVQVFGEANAKEKLNSDVKEINEDVLSFLYYHYMSERVDSDFWRYFTTNNKIPDKLSNMLKSPNMFSTLKKYNFNLFNEDSWKAIKKGINYV